jgi:hypothetical protein
VAWSLAPSLFACREEANRIAPGRSRVSEIEPCQHRHDDHALGLWICILKSHTQAKIL